MQARAATSLCRQRQVGAGATSRSIHPTAVHRQAGRYGRRAITWTAAAATNSNDETIQSPLVQQLLQHEQWQLQVQQVQNEQLQQHQLLLEQLPYYWRKLGPFPQELFKGAIYKDAQQSVAYLQWQFKSRGQHILAAEVQKLLKADSWYELQDWVLAEHLYQYKQRQQERQKAKESSDSEKLQEAEQKCQELQREIGALKESCREFALSMLDYWQFVADLEREKQIWREILPGTALIPGSYSGPTCVNPGLASLAADGQRACSKALRDLKKV